MINFFLNIFDALEKQNVNYVLIGGFAINLYGLQRGTQDIDLFIENDGNNLRRLRTALKSIYNDDSINEITLEELNSYAVIRYGTPDNFNIDIITHIGKLFNYNDLEYKVIDLSGHKIKIATVETLLKLKSGSYRQIDISDVIFLKKIIKDKKNAGL